MFTDCTGEDKDKPVDFLLKEAVVQKDITVDFGFYLIEEGAMLSRTQRLAPRPWRLRNIGIAALYESKHVWKPAIRAHPL